jgi:competence protein ComEC
MATGLTDSGASSSPAALQDRTASRAGSIWRAPLVWVALAVTLGIVLDRYFDLPFSLTLLAAAAGLIAWALTRSSRQTGLALVYLQFSIVAFGAAYHHWHRNVQAPDDIGLFAAEDMRLIQVRGVIDEEPAVIWQTQSPLQSLGQVDPTGSVLLVTQLRQGGDWLPASGRARLLITGHVTGLHIGDEIEVVGRLTAPRGPANPGEVDYAAQLRDQRITAVITVVKTTGGLTRLSMGWPRSVRGWLAVVRGWGQEKLKEALPPGESSVATAMLLGEGSTMTRADWEKYIRTGVIHVLAISGQHLMILAVFLWGVLRLAGIRRRKGAWFVGLSLILYALITGAHPPAVRAAVMVGVYSLGLILARPSSTANAFALAWLIVAGLSPTDLFSTGCQLSFLAVAVIYWGTSRWFQRQQDPLKKLVEQSRPAWQRVAIWLVRQTAVYYGITLAVWLALVPLVAARHHTISPAGLVLLPPLILLTAISLIAGFLLLLAALLCPPLVPIFAWTTRWTLAGCEGVVNFCDGLSGSFWYLGDVPEWWLWVFYIGLLTMLFLPVLQRWHWVLPASVLWLSVGLASEAAKPPSDELRCTFLAVGHGGCTVLETPDGRTLLYDAGALTGPEVTRRQIAPYLWSRGIHRIDEVFLSHADLDHFNGLPSLLERFAVGQITCTPTFADKHTPAVRLALAAIEGRGVPVRIVRAGDVFTTGHVVLRVLHPPSVGPPGNENSRSLVLHIQHAGHAFLLTGDLEGAGLEQVLTLPPTAVDVLMAPHHGSRFTNTPDLAAWSNPKVVVSCEGPPRGQRRPEEPYTARGALFLGTWPHGAVTILSNPTGVIVETYQSRQRIVVSREP